MGNSALLLCSLNYFPITHSLLALRLGLCAMSVLATHLRVHTIRITTRPHLEPSIRNASRTQFSQTRSLHASSRRYIDVKQDDVSDIPAAQLHQKPTQEELSEYDRAVAADKNKQIRTPWMREGSDQPPVSRPRSAGAMTKGKL